MNNQKLATNLVKLRKERNLTQKELAQQLNYSDKVISKWERNESYPDVIALERIASFYQVSVDSLLKTDGNFEMMPKNENQPHYLQAKVTKKLSIIWFWFLAALTVAWLSTIFMEIVIFALCTSLYGIILMVFCVFYSYHTWEVDYEGHKIIIVNRPTKATLSIDGFILDQNNKIFTTGIKLNATLNGRTVQAYVSAVFKMKCEIIII